MENKEIDPENLGGLGNMLPAEVLKMLHETLELMHQTGFNNHGSKIQLVYVAPGAQHVDTQINIGERRDCPSTACVGREDQDEEGRGDLPEVLSTEAAMALWGKVREAGHVDAYYQPLLSRTQAAILADEMALRLGIKDKWKVFEALWQRQNMYKDYYRALGQKQSLKFRERLKGIFSTW